MYFLNVKGKNRAYKNKTLFIRLNNKKKNKKKREKVNNLYVSLVIMLKIKLIKIKTNTR